MKLPKSTPVIILIAVTVIAFGLGYWVSAPGQPEPKTIRQVEPPAVTETRQIDPDLLEEMEVNQAEMEKEIRDAIGTNTFDYCDMNPCDKNGDAIPQGE